MERNQMTESMIDSKIRLASGELKLHVQRELTRLACQVLALALLFSVLAVVVAVSVVERSS